MSSYFLPNVIEESSRGERFYDIYSRLLKDRIIFIQSGIDDSVANSIVAQLLFLDSEDPGKDIYLYINSPGGLITAGLAIYDTIQYITSDVHTVCIGQAAGISAMILCSGKKGKRYSLPNSRVILHQPFGEATGQASDIEIHSNELLRIKTIVNSILVKHTKKDHEVIKKDTERYFFMTSVESKNYGIIDSILEK